MQLHLLKVFCKRYRWLLYVYSSLKYLLWLLFILFNYIFKQQFGFFSVTGPVFIYKCPGQTGLRKGVNGSAGDEQLHCASLFFPPLFIVIMVFYFFQLLNFFYLNTQVLLLFSSPFHQGGVGNSGG